MLCPLAVAKGREKRWGSAETATAPFAERPSYFFFAFLAFLAAFFAFLAIVPPEGVRLCLMATPVVNTGSRFRSQCFTSRCLSLPPSYQM